LKFAHLIACGLVAAVAFPAAASAGDTGKQSSATVTAASTDTTANTASSSTLFAGRLDIPVADGSSVPADCQFPASLSGAANLELACVTAEMGAEEEVDIEYIAWLGQHGFRHSADIIGGFAAAREVEDGCEQTLSIYPHGDEGEARGIWFALEREPRCGAQQQTP
jgi:hypothetical protein